MAKHLSGPPSLTGQVALITGGAGGMGRAIATVFNGAGARVVATDIREHEDLGGHRLSPLRCHLACSYGRGHRRRPRRSRQDRHPGALRRHHRPYPVGAEHRRGMELDAVGQRAWRREPGPQAISADVRARLRQDSGLWLDRRQERRCRVRPRLRRVQGGRAWHDALDRQGRRPARRVRQYAGAGSGGDCRCGPASRATRRPPRTRRYRSAATVPPRTSRKRHCSCVPPRRTGSPAPRWISAAACGWIETAEPIHVR